MAGHDYREVEERSAGDHSNATDEWIGFGRQLPQQASKVETKADPGDASSTCYHSKHQADPATSHTGIIDVQKSQVEHHHCITPALSLHTDVMILLATFTVIVSTAANQQRPTNSTDNIAIGLDWIGLSNVLRPRQHSIGYSHNQSIKSQMYRQQAVLNQQRHSVEWCTLVN